MPEKSESEFVGVTAFAKAVNFSPDHIRRLCRAGAIPATRIGKAGSFRIALSHIDTFRAKEKGGEKSGDGNGANGKETKPAADGTTVGAKPGATPGAETTDSPPVTKIETGTPGEKGGKKTEEKAPAPIFALGEFLKRMFGVGK